MPSFIVDGMLGRLARWLRIAGYDTLYYRDMDDGVLIEKSLESSRVLLSRDRELIMRAKKKGVDAVLLNDEPVDNHLELLKNTLNLNLSSLFSRCPTCNGELFQISKENIVDRVPETSLEAFNEFWECNSCRNVYWKGSHWKNIHETLARF